MYRPTSGTPTMVTENHLGGMHPPDCSSVQSMSHCPRYSDTHNFVRYSTGMTTMMKNPRPILPHNIHADYNRYIGFLVTSLVAKNKYIWSSPPTTDWVRLTFLFLVTCCNHLQQRSPPTRNTYNFFCLLFHSTGTTNTYCTRLRQRTFLANKKQEQLHVAKTIELFGIFFKPIQDWLIPCMPQRLC